MNRRRFIQTIATAAMLAFGRFYPPGLRRVEPVVDGTSRFRMVVTVDPGPFSRALDDMIARLDDAERRLAYTRGAPA